MSAPALPVSDMPHKSLAAAAPAFSVIDFLSQCMKSLASLKLTVALFALGIVVIFIGTLAQTEADIWQVVRDYFHAWVMWVDVNLLFPKSFFPNMPQIHLPLIPMPGGMTVGVLMVINLFAAHGWRFKIQASGARLIAGLAVILAGFLVALLIIWSGHNAQGFQSKPPFSYGTFWYAFLLATAGLWLVGAATFGFYGIGGLLRKGTITGIDLVLTITGAIALLLLAALIGWGLLGPTRPSDEAVRIVWQFLQGGLAGAVLLIGCILVFRKRGGMVLLHAGILLLFFNEMFVAVTARERQVFLEEGQTTNYLRDIRTIELAIIDRSAKETDEHIVIPRSLLEQNFEKNRKLQKASKLPVAIADPKNQLPFDVAVLGYYRNADVKDLQPGQSSPATKGRGLRQALVELPIAKGTDSEGKVDIAGAYVKLTEKKTGKDLGTYLLSQFASLERRPEKFAELVTIGDKTWHLFLRFKHEYKPYTITLDDVRKDDYIASDTPRNYSSDIHIKDDQAGIDQPVHIKMNDPLRYRGDTFYQSGYHPPAVTGGREATTLQVVLNRGWMIPYVACMAVVIGMIAHFLIAVTRFIGRRESEEIAAGDIITADVVAEAPATDDRGRKGKPPIPVRKPAQGGQLGLAYVVLPCVTALVFAACVYMAARPPEYTSSQMDFYRLGQLPVAHLGRIKPLDTLARNTLRAISLRETVKVEYLEKGKKKTRSLPATQWLLEVAAGTDASTEYQVIRIDSREVLRLFELEERKSKLYSVAELRPQIARFETAVEAARKLRPEELTTEQRRILELDESLKVYITLVRAFSPPDVPPMPSREELTANPELMDQYVAAFRAAVGRSAQEMRAINAPRIIPLRLDDKDSPEDVWRPYPIAWSLAYFQREPDRTTIAFEEILTAYRDAVKDPSNAGKFNAAVARYETRVHEAAPPLWNPGRTRTEAYFRHVAPFYVGMPLYVMGFLLAIFGWLFRYKPLNWAAFTMIFMTFGLHTVAEILWIYISGRPPVTNLYSSAIFIGWAAVLFGLVLEAIFRLGLGNIVAAVAGFAGLLISQFLSAGGDTVTVLQAVLDTQFWLATHVVCITLGYAATYLSGLLGLMYVIFGLCTPLLNERSRKDLGRMIYGITCFAILFSFYGTVLGGLWADDSWGRFWGWDPKENGALIIVLWNALVLHARWDKMVADRGLAVLAIGGNVVTSWSWFGVNQLGVGLHAYGAFNGPVVTALVTFVALQFLLMGLGCLPKSWWWSVQADRDRFGPQVA